MDLDALKKAAEAATPGPWATDATVIVSIADWPIEDGPGWHDWEKARGEPIGRFVAEARTGDAEGDANSAFIALANPATVLDLIARIEAAEEALTEAASKFADYAVLHAAKGTPDADAKAKTNRDMSAMCSAALARIRGEAA